MKKESVVTETWLEEGDGRAAVRPSDPRLIVPGRTPAPPARVAPEDYPQVPQPEADGPVAGSKFAIGAGSALGVVALGALGYLTAGAADVRPLLFFPAAATGWWLGRRPGVVMALFGAAAAVVPSHLLGQPVTAWSVVSAVALTAALVVFASGASAIRARQRALSTEGAKRQAALGLLALQLRESVVSIDVAVPLLADPTKLDRAQGAAFDQVRRHARGLSRVANDLLAVDHIETRKLQLSTVPLDVAAFVLEIARQRIPYDRATILAPATPVEVQADPERLRQVLDHLLANALKFSAPGSGIMVSVSADTETARVDVTDHGVGLSDEDRAILFSRYGRIRDTRTANVPGIGLGLYLGKLIAMAHGGDITASSLGRGLGATFSLILPLAGRPRRPAPEVPASSFWD